MRTVMDRRTALSVGVSGLILSGRAVSAFASEPHLAAGPRSEISFDADWRFLRGDVSSGQMPSYDDAGWRVLDLPHDWRIEDLPDAPSDDGGATANPSLFAYTPADPSPNPAPRAIGPFDAEADMLQDADLKVPPIGSVKIPGGRGQGFTIAGIGWYRKQFRLSAVAAGRQVELRFDGVYHNADVWLNGTHLGFQAHGYLPVSFDLTPHLNRDGENVLAVRVDNRGKTSRWYSGSGIYRHTWLTITDAVRIPVYGVSITTPRVAPAGSTAQVEVEVASQGTAPAVVSVRTTVRNASGRALAIRTAPAQSLEAGATIRFTATIDVPHAALWNPETPHLHSLESEVLVDGRVVDAATTRFGFRSLAFGAQGMLINGKPIKVHGANIHHDHGPLGTISLARSEERRVEVLKAAGFNAIRTAHNPASPALLDTCDRLGMLVYTEFADNWDKPKMEQDYSVHFVDHWRQDLTSMIRRDRNHPSIIIWSIGNEVFEDPNDYGPKLAAHIRTLDTSRPIAQGGMNFSQKDKNPWEYVDVGDYHGAPPSAVRTAHANHAFLQSEDTADSIYNDWVLEADANYVGNWVWAGWDYLGESGGGATVVTKNLNDAFQSAIGAITGQLGYPWVVSGMGDIDLIGQRKPQNYLRAVVNGLSPLEMMVERPVPLGMQQFNVLYCYYDELESWTWDVPEGQALKVRIYTRGDSVTLLLNGKQVATKAITGADKCVATFDVPYAPGELTAVTSFAGKEIARKSLLTVGKPVGLRLKSDVRSLTTARDELAHILVEVIDAHGRIVPDAVIKVDFAVAGAGSLAGVANGNPHNADSYKRPRRWTWHGQALAILRPAKQAGSLLLTATAEGLEPATLSLPVMAANFS
jgi:beta-galactosidase